MATVYKFSRGNRLASVDPQTGTARDVPLLTREFLGADVETCSFCGQQNATGYWHGHLLVCCCQTCATDVLPKLLADALLHESTLPAEATRHLQWGLERALKHFWYAATYALAGLWRKQGAASQTSEQAGEADRSGPCHQCGLPIQNAIFWSNEEGAKHVFCDNDCLSQWIADGQDALCHQIRREQAEADLQT